MSFEEEDKPPTARAVIDNLDEWHTHLGVALKQSAWHFAVLTPGELQELVDVLKEAIEILQRRMVH